jgi:signal transduction histidine kinase
MKTIRRKISILLVVCSLAAILLTMMIVNFTINNIFEEYMENVQNRRYEIIVTYLEDSYKNKKSWDEISGVELMHEAYMSNYNLTLYDKDNKPVWGMDPMDIRNKIHLENMKVQDQGVYTTKKFELKYNEEVVGYVEVGQYSSLLMTEEDVLFKESINKSIGLIIITLASLYFSRQFSAPIKEVANMSVKLSQGEFKEKSNVETDIEEIENLKNSINILADKLNNQDMLRKRLVSDISHEIRTPLNVVQNNLEAMIDGVFPVSQERLVHLNDEIIRFGKLLNNLEKLKEFESESMNMNFKSVNLFYVLENLYNDFLTEAGKKNITLSISKEEDVSFFILGDADRLKQVFINILNNAVKFTGENGEISIKLYKKARKIFVEIHDNGTGINKEDLPFIFEHLYRGDKSRHQTEGSGIGLTIAKNILDLHSASIEVESQEGKGSMFRICFNSLED